MLEITTNEGGMQGHTLISSGWGTGYANNGRYPYSGTWEIIEDSTSRYSGEVDLFDVTSWQYGTYGMLSLVMSGNDFNSLILDVWGMDSATEPISFQGTLSYTPIPIPAGIWLFGSGLLVLLGFRVVPTKQCRFGNTVLCRFGQG